MNNHDAVNQRPLAPVAVDAELADAIGFAISENLGELERALEWKFDSKRTRDSATRVLLPRDMVPCPRARYAHARRVAP